MEGSLPHSEWTYFFWGKQKGGSVGTFFCRRDHPQSYTMKLWMLTRDLYHWNWLRKIQKYFEYRIPTVHHQSAQITMERDRSFSRLCTIWQPWKLIKKQELHTTIAWTLNITPLVSSPLLASSKWETEITNTNTTDHFAGRMIVKRSHTSKSSWRKPLDDVIHASNLRHDLE